MKTSKRKELERGTYRQIWYEMEADEKFALIQIIMAGAIIISKRNIRVR